jgi:hypothetical protein
MGDRDLERELRELAIDWPSEPALADRVQRQIVVRARRRRASLRPALVWAVVLALVAFGTTMAVSPSARSAVLELVGLRSARIERREPSVSPGAGLRLGARVTLAQARDRAGFDVAVPAALGAPDAVHLDRAGGRARVALVYRAQAGRPRLLVQTLQAIATPLIEKSAGAATRVRRLRIDGAPAAFLQGAHGFAFLDQSTATFEAQRLAGNTLLLERGGLLTRIEGNISLARAIAIARSLQ